jgi:hypothetical protein
MPPATRFTVDQLTRLHAIVDAWNAVRRDDRRRATASEVIDYLLTQEEIGIEAMTANEMREELQRENLADEKPLPPIVVGADVIVNSGRTADEFFSEMESERGLDRFVLGH